MKVVRRLIVPAIAVAVCLTFMSFSIRPQLTASASESGSDIRFTASRLNPGAPAVQHMKRVVEPELERLAPWISAVGASVAAADFNNDGLADEACLVDPRDDSVRVFAIPGSKSRMLEQVLSPATKAGAPTAPMGCVPVDINEDGFEDAIVYYWGRSPVIFYGSRSGTFTPAELVEPSEVWNTTTVNVADIDGDGHVDILVGNYFPDNARVLDPDASDDAYVQMQDSMSKAKNAGQNHIFLTKINDGHATFQDASTSFPADSSHAWTLSFGVQDLDHDGLPDVYVANDFGPDQLLVNTSRPGRVSFNELRQARDATTAKSSALGHDSFKGMGVAFPHVDNSADPSIMVSNITESYALEESNFMFRPHGNVPQQLDAGRVPYKQDSEHLNVSRSGWSWDLKTADFDGSGNEDIVQATGFVTGTVNRWQQLQELAMANDYLLHIPNAWFGMPANTDLSGHDANKLWCYQPRLDQYRDCAPVAGIADKTPTRAFAVTDFSGDGKPDLLEANQWAPSTAYTNVTTPRGNFVWVTPVVKTPSGQMRAAIGAQVTLGTPTPQVRQLYPANGHTGTSAPSLEFGVPKSVTSVPVQVSWRDADGRLHEASTTVHPGANRLVLASSGEVARS